MMSDWLLNDLNIIDKTLLTFLNHNESLQKVVLFEKLQFAHIMA